MLKNLREKIDGKIIETEIKTRKATEALILEYSDGDSQFVGATILILVCVVVGALYLGITKTSVTDTMKSISTKITTMLNDFNIGVK